MLYEVITIDSWRREPAARETPTPFCLGIGDHNGSMLNACLSQCKRLSVGGANLIVKFNAAADGSSRQDALDRLNAKGWGGRHWLGTPSAVPSDGR